MDVNDCPARAASWMAATIAGLVAVRLPPRGRLPCTSLCSSFSVGNAQRRFVTRLFAGSGSGK
jgi:hypothetical protein